MTAKENVLNIYPEAEIKVLQNKRDGRKVPLSIYLVEISSDYPDFNIKHWHKKMYTIGVGSTLDNAWESAWKNVQTKMLRKLEYDS